MSASTSHMIKTLNALTSLNPSTPHLRHRMPRAADLAPRNCRQLPRKIPHLARVELHGCALSGRATGCTRSPHTSHAHVAGGGQRGRFVHHAEGWAGRMRGAGSVRGVLRCGTGGVALDRFLSVLTRGGIDLGYCVINSGINLLFQSVLLVEDVMAC